MTSVALQPVTCSQVVVPIVASITGRPGPAGPFAGVFDAHGNLVLAEAGPSVVATFALARGGALRPLASAATGRAATCRVVGAGDRVNSVAA